MNSSTDLTRGQAVILGAAALPMAAVGGLGAWGTYTNIATEFGRAATAAAASSPPAKASSSSSPW